MAKEQSSGMGGGIWGSLIDGIFNSVDQVEQLEADNAAFDRAVFFKEGKYSNKNNQDLIIFIGLLLMLGLVIFFFGK
ncbi:hypothetical protein [Aureispira anguillae]|uniref:Uncharacterized protein n=1 Tax=Aureispira anguillae TaxID=2864201 RepID=A0A915YBQ9_9BACT|nr:hypothetical protein [Aureispira anguillae]BDS10093.1 hypothetical protein AsAng_0008000 [Aureispira anguillae]